MLASGRITGIGACCWCGREGGAPARGANHGDHSDPLNRGWGDHEGRPYSFQDGERGIRPDLQAEATSRSPRGERVGVSVRADTVLAVAAPIGTPCLTAIAGEPPDQPWRSYFQAMAGSAKDGAIVFSSFARISGSAVLTNSCTMRRRLKMR